MRNFLTILLAATLLLPQALWADDDQPNIVLMVMDNLGWGELGTYGGGILRGAATPRVDSLADESMKLLNFNVEAQCTPSRSALMSGRYPIRSGTHSVVWGMLYGLTQWEVTIAELLSDQGYATGMYGKWHVGDTEGRIPTDQGFDEWYGVLNTTDEALYSEGLNFDASLSWEPHIQQATKGNPPERAKPYTRETRGEIDNELTDKTIEFMERNVEEEKPFFVYVPYTQPHVPAMPSKSFESKTGKGRWADMLANMDHNVGRVLDAIDDLGIRDNTLVIFMSENGPEQLSPHQGTAGPWRGTYLTGLEGSLRAPFLIRWPGKVKAGSVSNEIVHITDIYTTLAEVGGARIPEDRIVDGVDQLAFFTGKTDQSGREGVPIYQGPEFYGYKWRDYKVLVQNKDYMRSNVEKLGFPRLYYLIDDMKEEYNLLQYGGAEAGDQHYWVLPVIFKKILAHKQTLVKEPPIAMGTPDPYTPPGN